MWFWFNEIGKLVLGFLVLIQKGFPSVSLSNPSFVLYSLQSLLSFIQQYPSLSLIILVWLAVPLSLALLTAYLKRISLIIRLSFR